MIALGVRALLKDQRRVGIICGAGLAVVLRILLTVVAAKLLTLPYLRLAEGLLVLWIAFKVLVDVSIRRRGRLLRAISFKPSGKSPPQMSHVDR